MAKKKAKKKTTAKKVIKKAAKTASKKTSTKASKKNDGKKKAVAAKPAVKSKAGKAAKAKPVAKSATVKASKKSAATTKVKQKSANKAESLKLTTTLKKLKADKTQTPGILSDSAIRSIEKMIRQERSWEDMTKYFQNPVRYKMTEKYDEKMLIDHKTLGVGFIVSVENNRMKVLFEEGMKNLIMEYKK